VPNETKAVVPEEKMTITSVGILGGGPLGEAFARALARAEINAVISEDGWLPDSLSNVVATLRGWACRTTLKAAADEDVVFLAARWVELAETLARVADWEGRILIDATNSILPPDEPADIGKMTSSEIVRDLSPGAQLVKAFNALPPEVLAAEPQRAGGRRVVFLAGDHLRAKVEVGRLASHMGFAGIDLGGLASGGRLLQFPDGPLWRRNLISFDL
jgi:predicted dinucleotide-binding enzyme